MNIDFENNFYCIDNKTFIIFSAKKHIIGFIQFDGDWRYEFESNILRDISFYIMPHSRISLLKDCILPEGLNLASFLTHPDKTVRSIIKQLLENK